MASFCSFLPSFIQKPLSYCFSRGNEKTIDYPTRFDHLLDHIGDHLKQINHPIYIEKTKLLLNAQNSESCHQFLESVIQWSIKANQEKVIFSWLAQLLSLQQLSKIVVKPSKIPQLNQEHHKIIDSALNLVQKREECRFHQLPCLPSTKKTWNISSIALKIIFYPLNPLCLFLDAISFSEINKHYSTLWEKYLIVQVFAQGVLLAYYFGQFAIQSFFPAIATVAGAVGLVALVVFGAISTGIFIYYRWFRKPDDISDCENCERDWPINDPIVPRKETNEIIEALKAGKIVALSGRSGEGKTAILRDLVRRAKAGELGKNYRKFYSVNVLRMLADGKYSFTETLNHIVETAIKHNLCLIIDDIQYIYDRADGPNVIKALFNKPGLSMIAVAPTEDWKRIKKSISEEQQNDSKIETSGFFKENTIEIKLQDADKNTLKNILWRVYHKSGKNLPIDPKAMDNIIDQAEQGYLSKEKGLPTNAIALMESLIRHSEASFKPNFESSDLSKLKIDYDNAISEKEKFELDEKINQTRTVLEKQKKVIKTIEGLSKRYFEHQLDYMKLKHNRNKLSEKDKKWMLLTNFYGFEAFQKEILRKCKDKELENIDLIIDEALVDKISKRN